MFIENHLLEIVRRFQPDITAFCSRLLQIPSVNGLHDELDVALVIAEQARSLGLHVQVIGQTPRRPNVIISTAAEGETALLLLGHLDTVPPGDEQSWQYPPFSGTIADGKIYGRGAIDTKGGMSASLYALAALQQSADATTSAKRTQLICFPDEEAGATGELGVKFLHTKGLLKADGAIYAYSGNNITLGHRGLLRYRLICRGHAVHTGSNEWQEGVSGANAVTGMAKFLLELEQLPMAYSETKYFELFKTVITPGTMIQGGISFNVVPDYCEAVVDIRLTPEFNQERIEILFNECIACAAQNKPQLHFEYHLLNALPAAITDEGAQIVGVLETATEQVTSKRPQRVIAGPANEGYLLIERGIPTICGFGPTGANAHAVNEYVDIQGLMDATAIFALTAYRMAQL